MMVVNDTAFVPFVCFVTGDVHALWFFFINFTLAAPRTKKETLKRSIMAVFIVLSLCSLSLHNDCCPSIPFLLCQFSIAVFGLSTGAFVFLGATRLFMHRTLFRRTLVLLF
jgi:hypothetical protein